MIKKIQLFFIQIIESIVQVTMRHDLKDQNIQQNNNQRRRKNVHQKQT